MTRTVNTIAGELPESDLEFTTLEQDCGDTIVMSREWTYKGTDAKYAEHVGQMVRRDCWVTIKTGISATGSAEL